MKTNIKTSEWTGHSWCRQERSGRETDSAITSIQQSVKMDYFHILLGEKRI